MYRGPSASMNLVYAVDFSALATSGAKFSNGSNVIDGKTWTVENTANANTFQITNGTGLVIDPSATSTDIGAGSVRTAPLISIKYGSIHSSLVAIPTPNILVLCSFTHANLNANFEQGRLIHERFGGGGTSQITGWIGRVFSTSAKFEIVTLKNNAAVFLADTSATTDDVMGLYVQGGGMQLSCYTGVTSGGDLPAITALTRRGALNLIPPVVASAADEFAITLAAMPVNTNDSFSFTFKKLAVYAAYVG